MDIDIAKLLGYVEMEVIDFSFTESKVMIYLRLHCCFGLCPVCGKACTKVRSYHNRQIRDLDMLGKKTYLCVESRQFECEECKRYFTEDIGIVEGNHGLSKRYEAHLYEVTKGINIKQVCLKEDVCWAALNAIHKAHSVQFLQSRFIDWSLVRRINIDEIAVQKGKRNYACVIRDADTGVILDMLEKRDKATLEAYFISKGVDFCNQIEAVISDMWDGYVNLAGEKAIFKNAVNIIDLFHFVQHLGSALDGERRAARKEFPEEVCLKSLRWALLKSPENISAKEKLQLQKAFGVSENLAKVYQLRVELRTIFKTKCSKETGLGLLNQWEEKAKAIVTQSLTKFLVTVSNWKEKVANFFTNRITNAPLEGINNHIRSIIRRAFGYLDFQTLRRRVLSECG